MPVLPNDYVTPPDANGDTGKDFSSVEQRNEAPSDPVEMAEQRKRAVQDGDVSVEADGSVHQRPHGSMDETLLAKGKDHPEQGPYTPEHDHVDPDLEPAANPSATRPNGDSQA